MSVESILRVLLFTPGLGGRWGLPAIFSGPPGIGKSARLAALARECGLHVEVVLASLRQPEDFLGLPVPLNDGERLVTSYSPPLWAARAARAGRAVVFFDEINTAPPSVQAALLRVVLDGVVGDLQLPPGVRFVAAMNPVEDSAGGWDLAAPLANRFGHFSWAAPSPQEWTTYMSGGGRAAEPAPGGAEATEELALARWPERLARATGLVAGFLARKPGLLLAQPEAGKPQASGAWPSPRSWEYATRALALAPSGQEDALAAGFVGDGATTEFAAWRASADLPDPEALLEGAVKWKHDPKRLDKTVGVLSACTALVTARAASHTPPPRERSLGHSAEANRWALALWKIMAPVAESAADLVMPAASALVTARLHAGTPAIAAASAPVLAKTYVIGEGGGWK